MASKNLRDKWLKRLADEDKAHKVWRTRAQEADDAIVTYKDNTPSPLFPVFATTINLIHGRIYGQPPKPDVRKRHPSGPQSDPMANAMVPPQAGPMAGMPQPLAGMAGGNVPQGAPGVGGPGPAGGVGSPGVPPNAPADATADDNTIAICIERALSYTIDTTLFDRDAHLAVNDFLVAGCGIAKVEMETETDEVPIINPIDGKPLLDEQGQPITQLQISTQELHLRHFHWSQFRWEPCKDWRQCGWVSFDHFMTKEDIEDQFGVEIDVGSSGPSEGKESGPTTPAPQRQKYEGVYTVHEIWDKRKKCRVWITENYPKELDYEDDPLELEDFFPCPPPMMANVSGRELLPTPDYWHYQALVKEAEELSRRIRDITKQVKDISFYDDSFGELKKCYEYPDGTFIAVKDLLGKLRSLSGKADSSAVIYHLEMIEKVQVLEQLVSQRDGVKARIYEINGIADIQRGTSNPNDTATAQRIKNDWADIRTGQRVQTVALFFRDVFRIMSQLICQKFAPEQIMAMSGIELSEMQLATMRSELAESYAVDVESDSTMVQDDAVAQEQTTNFLQVFTGYLAQMVPAVQNGMLPANLAKEVLLLVKDSFKAGRQLEQEINSLPNTLQQLQGLTSHLAQTQQQAQQLQEQNQKLQQQVQQADMQSKANDAARVQIEAGKSQADAQDKQAHTQIDAAKVQIDASTAQVDNAVKIAGVHQAAHDSAQNHAHKMHDSAAKAQQAQQKASQPPAK